MTGWRLGYLAAPAFYAKACATIQSQTTSAPCSISQKAGNHHSLILTFSLFSHTFHIRYCSITNGV